MAQATITANEMHRLATVAEAVLGREGTSPSTALFLPIPNEESFGGAAFLRSDHLTNWAHSVIEKHAPRFDFLTADFEVAFLWKAKGGKAQGNPVLGKLEKPSGLAGYYSRADFVVWLAADHAVSLGFGPFELEAILFHELMHAGTDDDGKAITVGHDFEGFRAEIEQYGFWDETFRQLKAAVQARLFEDDDGPYPSLGSVLVDPETGEIR